MPSLDLDKVQEADIAELIKQNGMAGLQLLNIVLARENTELTAQLAKANGDIKEAVPEKQ